MKRGRRNERKAGGQAKGGEAEEESGRRTGEGPEAMRSILISSPGMTVTCPWTVQSSF